MGRDVHLSSLLVVFQPGDYPERSWSEEFEWLWKNDAHRMKSIKRQVKEHGLDSFDDPILLGSDGRVWDGHHRLAVAMKLGIKEVPVIFSGEEPSDD